MATIDDFNSATLATHSWRQYMVHGNSQARITWAAEQHPPVDPNTLETKEVPNWLGFSDELGGWVEGLPQPQINTSLFLAWTIPDDTTAYYKQGGTITPRPGPMALRSVCSTATSSSGSTSGWSPTTAMPTPRARATAGLAAAVGTATRSLTPT